MLEDAQLAKKRHLAAKLLLDKHCSVLDIGCGWGGLALYLADFCAARVTGITLSEQQHAFARTRATKSGLTGQAAFRLQDYRDVAETFDRIVSVGMFEHVGIGSFPTFFRKCHALLKDDGVMLLPTSGKSPAGLVDRRHLSAGGLLPRRRFHRRRQVERPGVARGAGAWPRESRSLRRTTAFRPSLPFPAPMLDGARAIQFLRLKAKELGIDPARIAACGNSAGAGIALWAGFHDDLADPGSADPVLRGNRLAWPAWALSGAQTSYDPRFIKQT